MRALIVIVWTIIGLVVGAVLLSAGIDAREGKAGMFAVFFGAPVGAVAGFALGLTFANRYRDDRRMLGRLLGGTILSAAAIVLGIYLFEASRTWDLIAPDSRYDPYELSYQVRLPAGAASPGGEKVGIALFSAKENPDCIVYDHPYGLTREGDRFLISGQCEIIYATPERTIGVRIGDGPTRYFKVKVKARPKGAVYSDWYPADQVKDNAPGAQFRAPRPDEVLEIRYGAR